MIQFIQVAAEFYELKFAIFGHKDDGNLHPTFHTDECNAEEMEKIEQAMEEIFDYAVELGGTTTGAHGVGLAKKKFLPMALGDQSINLARQLKQSLDPKGILNSGKIFDP
jgi:glycolate oxidase